MSYDNCINILESNIKSKWLEGNFIGEVGGENFSIKYSDYTRIGARYTHPVFYGKLIHIEEGTLIEGSFSTSTGYSVFEKFYMIAFLIASVMLFISFIINLFSNSHNPNYQNPVIMLGMCIISLIVGQGVPRIMKGFRDDDREKIKEFIITKLNITNNEI
jgi:hypothetical protein